MKRLFSVFLALMLAFSLAACGGGSDVGVTTEAAADSNAGQFLAGFGMYDITPLESVPLDSYGNSSQRMSDGIYGYLQARAVAITDEDGQSLLFIVGDMSWCDQPLGTTIKSVLSKEFSIPENHIVLSGTHTHAGVDTDNAEKPSAARYATQYVEGMDRGRPESHGRPEACPGLCGQRSDRGTELCAPLLYG